MKIKLYIPLKEMDGSPVFPRDEAGKLIPAKPAITLTDQVVFALCVSEQGLSGEDKFKRGLLAQRIYGIKADVELTIEEAALIKEVSGKFLSVLALVQVWNVLEKTDNSTSK